jgi:hypothetical protein
VFVGVALVATAYRGAPDASARHTREAAIGARVTLSPIAYFGYSGTLVFLVFMNWKTRASRTSALKRYETNSSLQLGLYGHIYKSRVSADQLSNSWQLLSIAGNGL